MEGQTKHIVKALATYAKYCGQKYLAVDLVYGDVTTDALCAAAGIPNAFRAPAPGGG